MKPPVRSASRSPSRKIQARAADTMVVVRRLRSACLGGFNSHLAVEVILIVAASLITFVSMVVASRKEKSMVKTLCKTLAVAVATVVAAFLVNVGAGVVTAGLT